MRRFPGRSIFLRDESKRGGASTTEPPYGKRSTSLRGLSVRVDTSPQTPLTRTASAVCVLGGARAAPVQEAEARLQAEAPLGGGAAVGGCSVVQGALGALRPVACSTERTSDY